MSQPISSQRVCVESKSHVDSLSYLGEVHILYWNSEQTHPLLQRLKKVLKRQMPTLR